MLLQSNLKNGKVKIVIELILILIISILPFIFFRDTLNLGSVIFGTGDSVSYYIPYRSLIAEYFKNLKIPLWNNFVFNGVSLIGNPTAYPFYPLVVVLDLFFNPVISYNILVILEYILGGIFFYFMLKEFNLNRVSSFIGSMIFMFTGHMISYRGFSIFFQYLYLATSYYFFIGKV